MRFKGLDLNLLVALEVLVEERSVSRSAARLHLSQPAMSAALSRLREYFNDQILAPHGKKMIPTPHALRLHEMVLEYLGVADSIVSASTVFDPAVTQRRFKICVSDYLAIVLFTTLVPKLAKVAPRIHLDLIQPSEAILPMLDQGELDLLITPAEHVGPDHPTQLLFHENHVVVGWRQNPMLKKRITEKQFFDAGHVVVEIGRFRPTSFAETHLRKLGRDRRIEVYVSSFAVAPEVLVNTQRVAVLQERLARAYAKRIDIAYVDLPFKIPVMRELMQFHRARASDTGLQWLMGQIKEAVPPA